MVEQDKHFGYIEEALFELASYKRKEDIPLIKKILLDNCWELQYRSFKLIKEYPDKSYMEILQKYFKHQFFKYACDDPPIDYPDTNEYFLNTLASYKNKDAFEILGYILKRKPLLPCPNGDPSNIKQILYYAIWNNRCEQFSTLLKEVELYIKESEKNRIILDPLEPIFLPTDSIRVYRWRW